MTASGASPRILIPPLRGRASEIPRIVDEYAADAVNALGASEADFTRADRTWVLNHAATARPGRARCARGASAACGRAAALAGEDGEIHLANGHLGPAEISP
jgi:hypothetical protein